MTINLTLPDIRELKPRITVFGVGGAGGNAVNNMITAGLVGCDFVVANTDAQALALSKAERIIQMGVQVTEGLGAGSQPEVGRAAAEEVIDEIRDHLAGAHMVFVTAGMGGGTGTGAAPIVAKTAKELGILTVGVVTKPFHFEGVRRMRVAEAGIIELQKAVDTLLIIPNQNLFRVANEKTTFADAFAMADQVLYSGVACITDLMVKEGLINLDFADVRAVMREMGKAMMGTGEASGEKRALAAAEAAISNPLIDDSSMKGARGLLISITGGKDLTLYEVDEAATRIREEVDQDANIIVGATFDESLEGIIRVSVVATGIDQVASATQNPASAVVVLARDGIAADRADATAARQHPARRRAPGPHRPFGGGRRGRCRRRRSAGDAQRSDPGVAVRPAPQRDRRGHDHADGAETVAVHGAFGRSPTRGTRGARRRGLHPAAGRNARPRGRRACRGSRTCRCRPRTRSAPSAARCAAEDPEQRRMSLLQRIAAVGLGRRDDDAGEAAGAAADARGRRSRCERPAPAPRHGMPEARPAGAASRAGVGICQARRRPPRHGPAGARSRTAARRRAQPSEDDHLDIPAFLRRQAN